MDEKQKKNKTHINKGNIEYNIKLVKRKLLGSDSPCIKNITYFYLGRI